MTKYPVDPGTIIQIPKGRAPIRTAPRRTTIPLEAKLERQRRLIRILLAVVVVLLITASAMGTAIYRMWKEPHSRPKGQNYSTVAKPAEDVPAEIAGK